MGGKASAPAAPDYSAIAAASEKAADYQYALGKEQLAWAKTQYAEDKALISKVVDQGVETMTRNNRTAGEDRDRYVGQFQPLEDNLASDARDFASGAREQREAGRAMSSVAQQFNTARSAAQQQLESFGIDPSSTRFAALDIGTRTAQAAAQAASGNQAIQQTDAMGRALRSEAINVGRGYPGQVATQYGTALAAGNSASQNTLAATASGAQTMGTGTQWQGMANQSLGTWSNALTQGYNAQLAQWQANQQASSGWGSALGMLGGIAGSIFEFEDGGAVPQAAPAGAIPVGATQGGPVPAGASPSGGRAIDDIDAKLNAGEFVVPKDVVQWKGEEFFQREIQRSREAKAKAPAKPNHVQAIPAAAPAFVSGSPAAIPA